MARKAEVIFVGDASSLIRASAEAKAAIDSVNKSASNSSSAGGIGKLPQLGGNIATAFIGAAPAVAGLAGALGAVTASAGAAVAGLGALSVGGVGALTAGFGSIALVVKPAVTHFQNVTKALTAYDTTMAKSGTTAKQAAAAHATLMAVVSQNGGRSVLAAVKAWDSLRASFQGLTKPASMTFFSTFNDALGTMKSLLPTVAGMANTSMAALASALQPVFKMLSGGQFNGYLKDLAYTFSQMIGPAVDGVAKIFLAFTRIAVAAGPFVVQFTKQFDALASRFAGATANSSKLSAVIGGLVSQTKSWIGLGGALTKLVFDVLKQGASSGQGLVNSLTGVLGQWDKWVTSVNGSQSITNFFQNSVKFTKELFAALGPVIGAIGGLATGPLPVYASMLKTIESVMSRLGVSTGIVVKALVAYKLALSAAIGASKIADAVGFAKVAAGSAGAPGLAAASGVSGIARATNAEVAAGRTASGAFLMPSASGIRNTVDSTVARIRTRLSSALSGASMGMMVGSIGTVASQAIGDAVHGAVGKAIKTVGTDASIGAGLGSVFGPAGMAGGAVVGGLVGSLTAFINQDVGNQGKRFAAKFTADIPVSLSKATTDALVKARDKVTAATTAPLVQNPNSTGGRMGGLSGAPSLIPTKADVAKIAKAYYDEGSAAGHAVIKGLDSVKDTNVPSVLSDFILKLKQLPKQAQPEAAKTMLAFATQLVQSGKLPKDALGTIIKGLSAQFPSLAKSFGDGTKTAVKAVVDNLKFDAATKTLKDTLATYRKNFGDWAISTKVTAADLNSNVKTAMDHLHATIVDSSGQTKRDAVAQYKQLQDQTVSSFTAMGQKVSSSAASMRSAIASGTKGAASDAAKNFSQFDGAVVAAMNSGILSSGKGSQLITQALNATLKAFGSKQIPMPSVPSGMSAPGKNLHPGLNAATGGLFQIGRPGDAGRDTVPLNVGGTPITVGAGEQVAVFNRHQLPIVNDALSPMGGLRGLFSKVKTPHYMATGGMVGSDLGAPSIAGSGTVPTLVRQSLADMTKAANAKIHQLSRSMVGGVSTAGLSGSLVQIVHQIAARMGWGGGQVQDWLEVITRESGGSMTAQNKHSGAYGIAQFINGPGEYAQYGGNVNTLSGQLVAMANYIRSRYGTPAAAWQSETSRGWYAKGGLVGDEHRISKAFRQLNALMGPRGDYNTAAEKLNFYPSLWQNTNSLLGSGASSFITTTNALGNPVAPSVNTTALNLTTSEENQELGWYGSEIKDIRKAIPIAQHIAPVIRDAIKRLKQQIADLKKAVRMRVESIKNQINENLRAMKALQDRIAKARNRKEPYPAPKSHAESAANAAFRQQIHDLIYGKDGTGGWTGEYKSLEAQNHQLGGTSTTVGTGGQIGAANRQLSAQVSALQKRITGMQTNLSNVTGSGSFSPLSLQGITGVGGMLGPALLQQASLKAGLASINPASISAALAAAQASYAPSNAGSSGTAGAAPVSPTTSIVGPTTTQELANLLAGMPALAPGGGRATGGPVLPGYVYRVGERGPEDVAFGAPGHVMTAAQTAGGGGMHFHGPTYFTGALAAKAAVDRLAYRAAIGVA